MDSKSMTRKDFFTLTFTLVGGAMVVAGCSSSASTNSGTGGAGGAAAGSGGKTGTDAAADNRPDTGPADTGIFCADPLPETQQPDNTGHTHTLTVPASTLLATTAQTVLTGGYPPDSSGAHFHSVMFSVDDLATLKGGGSVTVPSDMEGSPLHMHTYVVSCH